MRLDEKLDSGPIITLQKIVIEDDDNCENVYKKIVFFGKKILRDAIVKIINDEVNYVYQDVTFKIKFYMLISFHLQNPVALHKYHLHKQDHPFEIHKIVTP